MQWFMVEKINNDKEDEEMPVYGLFSPILSIANIDGTKNSFIWVIKL